MEQYDEYLSKVERRIFKNRWIAGWFRSLRNVKIDDLICDLLIYGHSRYFESKSFLLPRALLPSLYPYGTIAILFHKDMFLDIGFIEKTLDEVKNFMRYNRMKIPGGVEWGIDIAITGIASYEEISKDLADYILTLDPNIYDQYMETEMYGKKIHKKIGLALIDLKKEVAYSARDRYSRIAKKFFTPRPSLFEKIFHI